MYSCTVSSVHFVLFVLLYSINIHWCTHKPIFTTTAVTSWILNLQQNSRKEGRRTTDGRTMDGRRTTDSFLEVHASHSLKIKSPILLNYGDRYEEFRSWALSQKLIKDILPGMMLRIILILDTWEWSGWNRKQEERCGPGCRLVQNSKTWSFRSEGYSQSAIKLEKT